MKKKLICITGLDGIGKSTLIEQLKTIWKTCYVANIWDLLNSPVQGLPFKTKKQLDDFICGLTPDSRFLFLVHALKYSTDKAFESKNGIILFDSYYYKYVAVELALGANPKLVSNVMESFPVPDSVFELKLPLEEIVKRKTTFSRYECGLANEADKESFIIFQEKVIKEWQSFKTNQFISLDALKSVDELVQEIINKTNMQ